MFLWNSLAFSTIQLMLAIWSLVPLPFLNQACTSESSQFTYCWNLTGRILSITLLACEMSMQLDSNLNILWHCLFMGLESKEFFYSCGHRWVFQICWYTEHSTFTASSFRIWKSSAGIPSLPLVFFIVMLPKAQLTFQSKMSCSRWVITPSWLSGSFRYFVYSSSVYSMKP